MSVIDVADVLRAMPYFEKFASVKDLHALVSTLNEHDFEVTVAGHSLNGLPIHHVRFGAGSVKSLFVAYPHCHEPIGGLTVFGLMTALAQRNSALIHADVEWHIVPCIDPDGAILNESWTQRPFTLRDHITNFHVQAPRDQVDMSFPVTHNGVSFDQASQEAAILKRLIDAVRPDFYVSLHNTRGGGAWYSLSRDIGQDYYTQLRELLTNKGIPLRAGGVMQFAQFGEGVFGLPPRRALVSGGSEWGTSSWDYLAEVKPDTLSFVAEMPYIKHPSDGSTQETTRNLRQEKLRVDADNKFLVTVLLEEWERVKDALDPDDPLYKAVSTGASARDTLCEGLLFGIWPTRDILFNPAYSRPMMEGERFGTHIGERLGLLCSSYELVRLLKQSRQTTAVVSAIKRLDSLFDAALLDSARHIDLGELEVIDCNALAQSQLGSTLIALNSVIANGCGRSR